MRPPIDPAPSHRARRRVVELALLASVVFAFVAARGTPSPPAESADETAVRLRMANWAVRDARRWALEHGDIRIPWTQARGHLAIVIDDVGRELAVLDKLHSLRFALTFSVLPGALYAPGAQLRLGQDRRRPREILLHLPMEPVETEQMSTGANQQETFLLASDTPNTMRAKIEAALARVPAASGVNNHMGSRLTADAAAMRVVMGVVEEHGRYFLDSRTTASTVAESTALEMRVPALHRHIFMDHDPDRRAVERALNEAAERSLSEPTVVIGHPSSVVAEVLASWLPTLQPRGIGIYPLHEVLTHGSPIAARDPLARDPTSTHTPTFAQP